MFRLGALVAVLAVGLELCDEPTGPQPMQPIRPPPGYDGGQPSPAGPPAPPPPPVQPKAEAAAVAPAPVECPKEMAPAFLSTLKPTKDKKKRLELSLGPKQAGGSLAVLKVLEKPEGAADAPVVDAGRLTVHFPSGAKGKVSMLVRVGCGFEERTMALTADLKTAAVVLKDVPPPPEPGYLFVAGEPGAKVSLDGKELGAVPLSNVPVAPGKHQLRVTPPKGKPRAQSVEIKSGQQTRVSSALPEPKRK